MGVKANKLRDTFEDALSTKKIELEQKAIEKQIGSEVLDVTLSYPSTMRGHKHPLSHTSELLEDIFISMGYKIEDGPQIEDEKHNFDMLNIPDNHPARDVWDTFWFSDDINDSKQS